MVGNLSIRETRLLVSFANPDKLIYLWVWSPEWEQWKSVSLIDEIMQSATGMNNFPSAIPTPPKAINASEPGSLPIVSDQTTIAAPRVENVDDPSSMRKHKRFETRLPVTIIVNERRFETHTKDISLGGILVEEELPDWVAGYGSLLIEMPEGANIEVICSVVEDQKIGDKYRLEILPSAQFDNLKAWVRENESGSDE